MFDFDTHYTLLQLSHVIMIDRLLAKASHFGTCGSNESELSTNYATGDLESM